MPKFEIRNWQVPYLLTTFSTTRPEGEVSKSVHQLELRFLLLTTQHLAKSSVFKHLHKKFNHNVNIRSYQLANCAACFTLQVLLLISNLHPETELALQSLLCTHLVLLGFEYKRFKAEKSLETFRKRTRAHLFFQHACFESESLVSWTPAKY